MEKRLFSSYKHRVYIWHNGAVMPDSFTQCIFQMNSFGVRSLILLVRLLQTNQDVKTLITNMSVKTWCCILNMQLIIFAMLFWCHIETIKIWEKTIFL